MHTIKRSALVPYSAKQMFELVNDIEEYSRFLPWCNSSKMMSCSEEEVTASLEIAWKGIHKSFTTRNYLTPYTEIKISLVEGPLRHLEGTWTFQALGEEGCKVVLHLDFDFTGRFLDRFFEPIFSHISNSLVDAFCKRAKQVYGEGNEG